MSATPTVRAESFDDGTILFDPATGEVHRLDPPAALVWWVAKDAPGDVDSIVQTVAHAFELPRDAVAPEVESALLSLRDAGVVEISRGPEAGA